MFSTGDAGISCCGRKLNALTPGPEKAPHKADVVAMDDGYYLTIPHEMTKQHYISFMAWATYDRVLFVKLYPEQAAEIRIPGIRGGILYFYCSRHGLYQKKL